MYLIQTYIFLAKCLDSDISIEPKTMSANNVFMAKIFKYKQKEKTCKGKAS